MATKIHPTAIVDKSAELADGVSIGAYSIIGKNVLIAQDTWVGPHVVIEGQTQIGGGNRIFQFCSLGGIPQDKKYRGEDARLVIGDRNTIHEYCSFHIGTQADKNQTSIGDDNWIMAYAHIAHDCAIGNHVTFANGVSLAGHVLVEDYVNLGGFTLVYQWCHIGESVHTAASSLILQDVLPYVHAKGNPASICGGVNGEGLLRRKDIHNARSLISALEKAYKHVLYKSSPYSTEEIDALAERHPRMRYFLNFWERRRKASRQEHKRGIMPRLPRSFSSGGGD